MSYIPDQGTDERARATATCVVQKNDDSQITQVVSVIAQAFQTLPISLAVISEVDSASGTHYGENQAQPSKPSLERRMQHFGPQIRHLAHSGAEIVQTGDWSAVAIWCPPGFSSSPSDFKPATSAIVKEYTATCSYLQAKYMPEMEPQNIHQKANGVAVGMGNSVEGHPQATAKISKIRPFYHLEFIARNFEIPSVSGAISAAIVPFLQRAREEGVPAWLEAGSPQSRTVYERYGFRTVEEITVGRGRFDVSGAPKVDGEGVHLWAMIYDEHLR